MRKKLNMLCDIVIGCGVGAAIASVIILPFVIEDGFNKLTKAVRDSYVEIEFTDDEEDKD